VRDNYGSVQYGAIVSATATGASAWNYTDSNGFYGLHLPSGVYEFLEMSQALTEALQANDPQLIDRLAREQIGRRTLAHAAVTMVLDGRTSAAEAMTIAE